jgi:hemoglobin
MTLGGERKPAAMRSDRVAMSTGGAMTMAQVVRAGVLLGVLGGLIACAAVEPKPTLYERIRLTDQTGVPQFGRAAISLIVDDFVAIVVADARVNARFKGLQPAQVAKLKSDLSDQICEATGGPCSYLGRDMKTVHKGMKITDAEWNATVEDLKKALDKHRVPAAEQGELLALLGPMKADIVGQ